MATSTKTPSTPKAPRPVVKLADRIKNQINVAALRGKISVDDLQDLQSHITKVAGLLA